MYFSEAGEELQECRLSNTAFCQDYKMYLSKVRDVFVQSTRYISLGSAGALQDECSWQARAKLLFVGAQIIVMFAFCTFQARQQLWFAA